MRDLERKRNEFRKKIDEKRARMAQMTEAERDEFLFKLRYLRPDAAEPEESSSAFWASSASFTSKKRGKKSCNTVEVRTKSLIKENNCSNVRTGTAGTYLFRCHLLPT